MNTAVIKIATRSTTIPNAFICHLTDGTRTTLSYKQFKQFTDVDPLTQGAQHYLKGAQIDLTEVKTGEDIGNGVVATKDGYKTESVDIIMEKSNLINRLAVVITE